MTPSLRTLAALLTATALLAGCGSSDDDGGGGSSSSGAGSEETAAKSPEAILSATEQALGKVKSFHIEGTAVDEKDGEQQVAGDFGLPGKLKLSIEGKTGKMELLSVDKQTYFKADRSTWEAQGLPEQAMKFLVDKWVKMPADADVPTGEFESYTNPETIGYCLVRKGVGTVTSGGTADVDGQKTNVLVDKGDEPGAAPGKLYVAAEGESLPLRAEQTGPETPGGKPDPKCGETKPDDDNSTTRTDLRFSKYDEPVDIAAPADPVDLQDLQSQLQGGGGQAES